MPAPELPYAFFGHDVERRAGEHRPSGAIQVAGDDVQDVDQPLADPAEGLRRKAHAPVTDGAFRARELTGHRGDFDGVDSDLRRHPLGSVALDQGVEFRDVRTELGQAARTGQTLAQYGLEQRQQQQHVAAGPDEMVGVGLGRGFGAARVDQNDLAATCADVSQSSGHAGCGHQAAVRGHRIRAQNEEEVGAVDVRNRQQEVVAEHVPSGEVVRQLVDRGRGEQILRSDHLDQAREHEHAAEVVDVGVAEIHADRRAAVLVLNRAQTLGDLGKSLVPRNPFPARAGLAHGVL